MVIRLLVVGLTLIGAVPVQICTCGAHDHAVPQTAPVPDDDTDTSNATTLPLIAEVPEPARHHDHDCHFIKPRPMMPHGIVADTAKLPPAEFLASVVPVMAVPAVPSAESVCELRPPPNQPLFLTLLRLRN